MQENALPADFQATEKFLGFSAPSYTMVPDEVFDELLAELSGPELKVLLYIIRRTFGFKKSQDNISLNQMLHGITTKEGKTLDRGCGVKKKNTLLQAIETLKKRNLIITERQNSPERGNLPTLYRLHMKNDPTPPLVTKRDQGVVPNGYQGLGPQRLPHNMTVYNMTEKQQQLPDHDKNKSCTLALAQTNVVVAFSNQSPNDPQTQNPKTGNSIPKSSSLVHNLIRLGITEKTAHSLVIQYPPETIQNQITALPYRKAEEPTSVLVKAIRENWALPKKYTDALAQAEQIAREKAAQYKAAQEAENKAKAENEQKAQVDAYLARLSSSELAELEQQAENRIRQQGGIFQKLRIPKPMHEAFVKMIVSERIGLSNAKIYSKPCQT